MEESIDEHVNSPGGGDRRARPGCRLPLHAAQGETPTRAGLASGGSQPGAWARKPGCPERERPDDAGTLLAAVDDDARGHTGKSMIKWA